jgi:hypothetical protein
MKPAEAQDAFLRGKGQLVPGTKIPLVSVGPNGEPTVIMFPAEKVSDALNSGSWQFAEREQVLAVQAKEQGGRAAVEQSLDALTNGLSTTTLLAGGADPQAVKARAETGAGRAAWWGGQAAALALPVLQESSLARGLVAESRIASLTDKAVSTVLAPNTALMAATQAVEQGASKALGEAVSDTAKGYLSSSLANGVVGVGLGAINALNEEAMGNPNANAESMLAASGMGGLIGGAGGFVLGSVFHGASNLASRFRGGGKAGELATLGPVDVGEHMQRQGMDLDVDKSKPWLTKFADLIRVEGAVAAGADRTNVELLNSPKGQAFLRDRERLTDEMARDMHGVLTDLVEHQTVSGAEIGRVRPELTENLIGTASGGQSLATVGQALDDVKGRYQEALDAEVMQGRGEGSTARALKAQLQAMEKGEADLFAAAGVPQHYVEETVEKSATGGAFGKQKPTKAGEVPASRPAGGLEPVQGSLDIDLNRIGEGENINTRLNDDATFKAQDQAMLDHFKGLPAEDKRAITNWSGITPDRELGTGYDTIRRADRGLPNAGEEAKRTAQKLNQMIADKAVTVEMPLYRGLVLEEGQAKELLAKLQREGTHTENSLQSWSYDPKWSTRAFATPKASVATADPAMASAEDFFGDILPADLGGKDVGFLFRIEPGHKGLPIGHDIAEHEVIRSKGQYLVKDISQDAEGRYQVLLAPANETPAGTAFNRTTFKGQSIPPTPGTAEQLGFDQLTTKETVQRAVTTRSEQTKSYNLTQVGERFHLPDTISNKSFTTLDSLRGAFERVKKSAAPEIKDLADWAAKRFGNALEDKATFGKAAEFQADLSRARTAREEAYQALQKLGLIDSEGQVSKAAVRSYMDKMSNVRGDATKEALDRWMGALESEATVAEKYYKGSGFVDNARKATAKYGEVAAGMRDNLQIANALKTELVSDRARRIGSNGAIQYGLQMAAGAIGGVVGLPGAAAAVGAGPIIGSILQPGSAQLARAQSAGTVTKVGKVVQSLADAAIKGISAGGDAGLKALPRVVATATGEMVSSDRHEKRVDAFNKRFQELHTLADSAAYLDTATRAMGDLGNHVPAHSAAMTAQGQRAVNFLLTKLPGARPGTGGGNSVPATPSPAALLKFAQTDHAVQDPLGTFHRSIERGVMLPHEREALEAVSPQLLQTFQRQIAERAETGLPNKQKRLVESLVGGNPASRVAKQQAVWASVEAEQSKPGPTPKPTPRTGNSGVASDTDKLSLTVNHNY